MDADWRWRNRDIRRPAAPLKRIYRVPVHKRMAALDTMQA
jgi:hypothetical protein